MELESIEGVCEVLRHRPPEGHSGVPARLLIELPHGATGREDFESLSARLEGPFPDDLIDFFFVNTDVGSPELARALAESLAASGAEVVTLRSLLPRTYADCNRAVDEAVTGEAWTRATPRYVESPADRQLLADLHRRYQKAADEAYRDVCGQGGLAVALHTYAPRSVAIDTIDAGIVGAIRRAYEPDVYSSWPSRPEIDVISKNDDGDRLSPEGLVDELVAGYAALGVEAKENATYHLGRGTTGHRHASTHRGRVVCVEFRRDLVADPFSPFEEMTISMPRCRHLVAPLVSALERRLSARQVGARRRASP